MEKQKEEAVRLGVEFSLLVAEAMFVLSDDIRSVLLFCFWLLKYAEKSDYNGPVVRRVFLVIEYVFETYIKPKNGVYQDGGKHPMGTDPNVSPEFLFWNQRFGSHCWHSQNRSRSETVWF